MKRLCLLLIGMLFCSFTFSEEPQYKLLDYSAWDGSDDSNNDQKVEVYQPYPIIFIHGFAGGKASTWDNLVNYSTLKDHFVKYDVVNDKYITIYKPFELKKGTKGYATDGEFSFLVDENKGRLPYLERMDMLDKNGSIDTYNSGDEITLLNPQKNTDGWADKIKGAIDFALANVNTDKVILVCHSMGGLAARKLVTNSEVYPGYADKVARIITINTPHAGSPLARMASNLCNIYHHGWKFPDENLSPSASAALCSLKVLDVLNRIRLRAFRSHALQLHLYTTFQN